MATTQGLKGRKETESSRNLCTERSPKESDDTRCCNNTIVLLKMSTIQDYNKCIEIKNLCIKLVKKKKKKDYPQPSGL